MRKTLGAVQLSARLKELGVTLAQAEVLIGYRARSGCVCAFTRGHRIPPLEVCGRIERQFGVPIASWLTPAPKAERRKQPAAEAA